MIDLPEPLAVACDGAGAANIILRYLECFPGAILPVMRGPAARLWAERFPGRATLPTAEAALAGGAAALLSGTGWNELEHQARIRARDLSIWSVAVIDHWVNYRARFERGGDLVLPDEIWVTDAHALAIAHEAIPEAVVRLKPNPYFEQQVAAIAAASLVPEATVLYVLEPTGTDWGRSGLGEFQALDYFLERLSSLGLSPRTPIRLRPHPTDPPGKYDEWIGRQRGRNVTLDRSSDLAEAVARVAYVAGLGSFALTVALAAGRKVVCTLPPWAPACVLPHDGLIHLNKIAGR